MILLIAALLAAPAHAGVRAYLGGLKPDTAEPSASSFASELALSGSRGERLDFLLRADGCVEPKLELRGFTARFFEVLEFRTSKPSYRGARTGAWLDPVVPREGSVCGWILGELRIPEDAKPGTIQGTVAGIPLKLKVWGMTMPESPAVPLYSELTTWFLLLGHYGKWHEGEAELGRSYIRSMLEHRIAPLKHWVRVPELAGGRIDPRAGGRDSLFSTVVEPLPSWAWLSMPFPAKPGTEWFSALGKALKAEPWGGRAFTYLWDEPAASELAAVRDLAKRARAAAPGLRVLVTTPYKRELEDGVDVFAPVMDQFDRRGYPAPSEYARKKLWLYVSCMSHGCGNDFDSGSPDFVIDRPGTHIRSLAWIARKYGAEALLYYSVDNGFQNFRSGRDPWNDLWDFSGNGDGTLYYPGRPGLHGLTEHAPVESLRLKLWRQSSYDADYAAWMDGEAAKPSWWPHATNTIARSPREWEHDDSKYRDLRERMGDYLNSQLEKRK